MVRWRYFYLIGFVLTFFVGVNLATRMTSFAATSAQEPTAQTALEAVDASTMGQLTGVTMLAAGEGHSCALLADRTVKCWG